jgi:hypothetical protein
MHASRHVYVSVYVGANGWVRGEVDQWKDVWIDGCTPR